MTGFTKEQMRDAVFSAGILGFRRGAEDALRRLDAQLGELRDHRPIEEARELVRDALANLAALPAAPDPRGGDDAAK